MRYGVMNTGKAVYLIECETDDDFFSKHPYYQLFYSFSEAVNKFEAYSSQYYKGYYAKRLNKTIIIASFLYSLQADQEYDGPYDSLRIAYGVMRIGKEISSITGCDWEDEFSIGARLIYDYPVDCGDEKYFCRLRTTGVMTTGVNIYPLNTVDKIHSGDQVVLRLLGRTEDISVFSSPENLKSEKHLPAKILIPIGTYYSAITDQDASVVLTGMVTDVFLISEKDIRRYQVTVHTRGMAVDLDILTHYSLHEGDYIYVQTELSAYIN